MKYSLFYISLIIFIISLGLTYAVLSDTANILGASFSTTSTDIKFLASVSGGLDTSNLADSLAGPKFHNISSGWVSSYPIKILNNASEDLILTSSAFYETANDPESLRSIINIEVFPWEDVNNNGLHENSELATSLGKKTIIKWKTEGFELGTIKSGEVKGYVLEFSVDTLVESKQGASGLYDFEFTGSTIF